MNHEPGRVVAAAGALALVWLVLGVGVASADTFGLFGAGARGTAMGGAMTAETDDFASLYYNLAAMTETDATVGFGLMGAWDRVRIRLKERPSGYDLPSPPDGTALSSAPRIPTSFRLRDRENTEDVLDSYGFLVGAIGSFGIDRLRIGVLAYLPLNRIGLQQTHYADEREQYFSNRLHFELLGTTTQGQTIIVGSAWRLTDWMSLGLGLSFLPGNSGTNLVYLDNPTDQSQIDIALDNEQKGKVTPHAGLLLKPVEDLKIGASYRGELWFPLNLQNEVQVRTFQGDDEIFPVVQDLSGAVNYSPHQISVGVSWVLDRLTLSADLQYAMWSRYMNNQGERVDQFEDTVSYRGGGEYRLTDWAFLRLGASWEPSPVPPQTGRTNYVDNDRMRLSLGTGHPFKLFGEDVTVAWAFQLQHMIPLDTNKAPLDSYPNCVEGETRLCDEIPDDTTNPETGDPVPEYQGLQTGNPGFPGFGSSGQLYAVSLDIQWAF